jgi:hypothetical protein
MGMTSTTKYPLASKAAKLLGTLMPDTAPAVEQRFNLSRRDETSSQEVFGLVSSNLQGDDGLDGQADESHLAIAVDDTGGKGYDKNNEKNRQLQNYFFRM